MLNLALVLTAAPGSRVLTSAHADDLWARMPGHRVDCGWLSDGAAWEARVLADDRMGAEAIERFARETLAGLPVDVNLVADDADRRRKRLLVADLESTIIGEECLDEIARAAGLGGEIAALTRRAMNGEIAFEPALRERVALLKGLDAKILDAVYARVTLTPGAATLVATMKAHGAHAALVSGGFSYFTERVAQRLGFDSSQANVLEVEAGTLTGRVAEPVLGRAAKLAALERLAAEQKIDLGETLAVGDGANDLDMIRRAGLGVAFRAKPIVAGEAAARIVHGDLTALLHLQGYRRAEFVT